MDSDSAAAAAQRSDSSNEVSWEQTVTPRGDSTPAMYTRCLDHASCGDCDKAVGCHWCAHDETCHAKGSVHGCGWGASCSDSSGGGDKKPSGCAVHDNCVDCSSASTCHWCAFDNACHRIGSRLGCLNGVDCYSNDRCKRKEPEKFAHSKFTAMPFLPIVIVASIGCCLVCCASTCFCVATGVKGAYDDLAALAGDTPEHSADTEVDDTAIREPLLAQEEGIIRGEENGQEVDGEEEEAEEGEAAAHQQEDGDSSPEEQPEHDREVPEQPGQNDTPEEPQAVTDGDSNEVAPDERPANEPESGYVHLSELMQSSTSDRTSRRSIRARRPVHMQRLYNSCMACYIFTLMIIGLAVLASIRFYPSMPVYNICNDAVAWQAIIDNFKSKKPAADIEILGSISNPNHIDVTLEKGTGQFYHNNNFVGTYDIPPVTVEGNAITDFLIIAHLSPKTWEALSLTKEYTAGHLILYADTQVTIRVPLLANYRLSAETKHMEVRVNELADRSLCACPTWDEPNTTLPGLKNWL